MSTTDYEKIQRLFEQTYAENVISRDIDAYVSMYTSDAFWSPPNAPDCHGHAEIAEGFAKQIASVNVDPVFTAEEIKVFGDTAYVLGSSIAQITNRETGESKQSKFAALWIVALDCGDWRISRQLWNNKP